MVVIINEAERVFLPFDVGPPHILYRIFPTRSPYRNCSTYLALAGISLAFCKFVKSRLQTVVEP
jgi:hypothetical protein